MMPKRSEMVFVEDGLAKLQRVIRISNAYYVALPAHWARAWFTDDDPRVLIQQLDDGIGFRITLPPEEAQRLQPRLPWAGPE